jgi:flagellar basal body-associated protein FliL
MSHSSLPVVTVERVPSLIKDPDIPSPTIYGIPDFMASPNAGNMEDRLHVSGEDSSTRSPRPRRNSSVETTNNYDHHDSFVYRYWTTAYRVGCLVLLSISNVMFAFNMFLAVVDHIENMNAWRFVQELLQAFISLSCSIFAAIGIYSTWKTTPRDERKKLAIVALVGICIGLALQLFMVFFPFITGLETAPSTSYDIFTNWATKSDSAAGVIVVPLIVTVLLFSSVIITSVFRIVFMVRYDSQQRRVLQQSEHEVEMQNM